ncbi:ABC transporter transmembrane domain-containing protein [Telmatospirillum sp.]|uniref:ABC transporter transmembrane domain-containing protein n=1 Tax=Telmatospirillum sp. TaxID=2079197 RepID=UPI00284C143D|nr:ABC transporter transmembrane domain-containing protein [Telmatospirillum sp.]MDR3437042.1 ABC transporter transmembrane domain-containing protein [Telmatospirillum sp.]
MSEATPLRLARLRPLSGYLRPYRWRLAGAGVALIISSLMVLLLGQGLRHIVDQGLRAGDASLLDRTVIAFCVVVVLLAAATGARFYLVSWIGERVVADLRIAAFRRIIGLSPAFFETTKTGDVLSRLTTDTELLQTVIGSSLSLALRNLLTLAGAIVMLAVTSPKLTGIVLVVVPAAVAPIIFFGRKVRALSRKSQDRVADVGAYVEESVNAIRTVQAFTHEKIDHQRFAQRVTATFAAATARIQMRALMTMAVIFLAFGAVAVVLWVGGYDVIAGRMTGGALSAFVFYAILVAVSGGTISEVIGDLQRAAGAAERIVELLATQPDISAPAEPRPLPTPAVGRVEFDAVTFHYPARPDHAALHDITLCVDPGQSVALVGPSGAGKSTVFQLLLRFYDPTSGTILIDGVDIRSADPADVRRHVGLVAQDPVIFGTSARENIRYGNPDASDEEVRAAADAAAVTTFLDTLPDGFDTFLGEKGVRLSGGQRQRIAIARAILRNPSILLLDEATSALDAESERDVQAALERLAAGRTTLTIAHRLATVLRANRIIVIDEGGIVAEGTHESLIAAGGLYARLAALQFTNGEKEPLS